MSVIAPIGHNNPPPDIDWHDRTVGGLILIWRLHEAGASIRAIAETFDMSKSTIHRVLPIAEQLATLKRDQEILSQDGIDLAA